ncbi:MAG: orotidine-5'-phosphate decarboxylase [Planctomycetes bacterium]|nr:orotidine-5'-phosphate decarboxylase [Planctomycetota bacterium]
MNNFADRLTEAIQKKKSCVIVGLDPRLDLIPKALAEKYIGDNADNKSISRLLLQFNKAVIKIISKYAVGVKPQSAFYEKYGWWGVKAFWETMEYSRKKGLLTIADIKRGDVPSTSEAYAEAYLGKNADAIDSVTVNPFLGGDSLLPFIKAAKENGKGLFVLVKTSNAGSKDFQDKLLDDGKPLYNFLARKVSDLSQELVGESGYSSVGAVVGATFPQEAKILRELMPRQFFLVPGYGAQGATADDIKICFNRDGLGAVINASRSIIHPSGRGKESSVSDWSDAVRSAVLEMKQSIRKIIK